MNEKWHVWHVYDSLEKLAEEAKEKKKTQASNTEEKLADDQQEDGICQANDSGATTVELAPEEGGSNTNSSGRIIHISDAGLAKFATSPHSVWEHMEALKQGYIYSSKDVSHIASAVHLNCYVLTDVKVRTEVPLS